MIVLSSEDLPEPFGPNSRCVWTADGEVDIAENCRAVCMCRQRLPFQRGVVQRRRPCDGDRTRLIPEARVEMHAVVAGCQGATLPRSSPAGGPSRIQRAFGTLLVRMAQRGSRVSGPRAVFADVRVTSWRVRRDPGRSGCARRRTSRPVPWSRAWRSGSPADGRCRGSWRRLEWTSPNEATSLL